MSEQMRPSKILMPRSNTQSSGVDEDDGKFRGRRDDEPGLSPKQRMMAYIESNLKDHTGDAGGGWEIREKLVDSARIYEIDNVPGVPAEFAADKDNSDVFEMWYTCWEEILAREGKEGHAMYVCLSHGDEGTFELHRVGQTTQGVLLRVERKYSSARRYYFCEVYWSEEDAMEEEKDLEEERDVPSMASLRGARPQLYSGAIGKVLEGVLTREEREWMNLEGPVIWRCLQFVESLQDLCTAADASGMEAVELLRSLAFKLRGAQKRGRAMDGRRRVQEPLIVCCRRKPDDRLARRKYNEAVGVPLPICIWQHEAKLDEHNKSNNLKLLRLVAAHILDLRPNDPRVQEAVRIVRSASSISDASKYIKDLSQSLRHLSFSAPKTLHLLDCCRIIETNPVRLERLYRGVASRFGHAVVMSRRESMVEVEAIEEVQKLERVLRETSVVADDKTKAIGLAMEALAEVYDVDLGKKEEVVEDSLVQECQTTLDQIRGYNEALSTRIKREIRSRASPEQWLKFGEEIGEGGEGRVRAGHVLLPRGRVSVAVKALRRSEESAERNALRMLGHVPFVLPLLAEVLEEGRAQLIFPRMEGTLGNFLSKSSSIGMVEVLQMLATAVQGLVNLRARGVVHRDVKLDNILVIHRTGGLLGPIQRIDPRSKRPTAPHYSFVSDLGASGQCQRKTPVVTENASGANYASKEEAAAAGRRRAKEINAAFDWGSFQRFGRGADGNPACHSPHRHGFENETAYEVRYLIRLVLEYAAKFDLMDMGWYSTMNASEEDEMTVWEYHNQASEDLSELQKLYLSHGGDLEAEEICAVLWWLWRRAVVRVTQKPPFRFNGVCKFESQLSRSAARKMLEASKADALALLRLIGHGIPGSEKWTFESAVRELSSTMESSDLLVGILMLEKAKESRDVEFAMDVLYSSFWKNVEFEKDKESLLKAQALARDRMQRDNVRNALEWGIPLPGPNADLVPITFTGNGRLAIPGVVLTQCRLRRDKATLSSDWIPRRWLVSLLDALFVEEQESHEEPPVKIRPAVRVDVPMGRTASQIEATVFRKAEELSPSAMVMEATVRQGGDHGKTGRVWVRRDFLQVARCLVDYAFERGLAHHIIHLNVSTVRDLVASVGHLIAQVMYWSEWNWPIYFEDDTSFPSIFRSFNALCRSGNFDGLEMPSSSFGCLGADGPEIHPIVPEEIEELVLFVGDVLKVVPGRVLVLVEQGLSECYGIEGSPSMKSDSSLENVGLWLQKFFDVLCEVEMVSVLVVSDEAEGLVQNLFSPVEWVPPNLAVEDLQIPRAAVSELLKLDNSLGDKFIDPTWPLHGLLAAEELVRVLANPRISGSELLECLFPPDKLGFCMLQVCAVACAGREISGRVFKELSFGSAMLLGKSPVYLGAALTPMNVSVTALLARAELEPMDERWRSPVLRDALESIGAYEVDEERLAFEVFAAASEAEIKDEIAKLEKFGLVESRSDLSIVVPEMVAGLLPTIDHGTRPLWSAVVRAAILIGTCDTSNDHPHSSIGPYISGWPYHLERVVQQSEADSWIAMVCRDRLARLELAWGGNVSWEELWKTSERCVGREDRNAAILCAREALARNSYDADVAKLSDISVGGALDILRREDAGSDLSMQLGLFVARLPGEVVPRIIHLARSAMEQWREHGVCADGILPISEAASVIFDNLESCPVDIPEYFWLRHCVMDANLPPNWSEVSPYLPEDIVEASVLFCADPETLHGDEFSALSNKKLALSIAAWLVFKTENADADPSVEFVEQISEEFGLCSPEYCLAKRIGMSPVVVDPIHWEELSGAAINSVCASGCLSARFASSAGFLCYVFLSTLICSIFSDDGEMQSLRQVVDAFSLKSTIQFPIVLSSLHFNLEHLRNYRGQGPHKDLFKVIEALSSFIVKALSDTLSLSNLVRRAENNSHIKRVVDCENEWIQSEVAEWVGKLREHLFS